MVKGASTPGTGAGWDVERQDLDQYLTRGWVDAARRDRTSLDYSIGGSETLEYAIDDYAIAQVAAAECPARPARTVHAHGREHRRGREARHVLLGVEHQPQATVRLGRQRTRARHPLGVRLRRRAVAHAGCGAAHRHAAVRAHTQRRT